MRTILFDLDGTITQPASGIINSFSHALRSLGKTPPKADALGWVIGPALRESFGKFFHTPSDIEAAVRYYREFYSTQGILDAHLFEDIPQTLATLHNEGYQLFICTAKPRPYAVRVLEHFKISCFFQQIYGPGFDGQLDNKADLLKSIIQTHTLSPNNCCLVGDRCYDAIAALHNGVTPIGVLWGFGSEEELKEAGVELFCTKPGEIPGMIRTLSQQPG